MENETNNGSLAQNKMTTQLPTPTLPAPLPSPTILGKEILISG